MKKLSYTLLLLLVAITASAEQTWWGLWNSGLGLEERSALYPGKNNLYVRLTAQNSAALVDGQISGLRFYLNDKTDIKAATVWISASDIENGKQPTVMSQRVDVEELRDLKHNQAPTEVRFDQAYSVLPAANRYATIYAGVTLEIDSRTTASLMASPGKGTTYSNFYNGNDIASGYGALALQVLIEGPNLPQRGVSTATIDDRQIKLKNSAAQLSLPTTNSGAEAISSVDYTVSIDGQPRPSCHYDLPSPVDELGKTITLPIDYDTPEASGDHSLSVVIDKVNGQPNMAPATQTDAELLVLDRMPLKRTVMEEFTGTWCLNCVRGIAGIKLLEEEFGDRFVAIAMHSDDPTYNRDPMVVSHYRNSAFYKNKISILGGLPSCTIDRYIDGDPYCGYMSYGPYQTDQLVREALSRPAVAELSLNAAWADEEQTAIDYTVSTNFAYNSADNPYSLILVLTADGLTGEDNRWRQRNGYNDYTGDEEALLVYANAGNYLPDRIYNHVAIDIVGVDMGIEGSISAPLQSGTPQIYTHRLATADNELVQDKSQLSAIAMLVDTRDGSVSNVAKTSVGAYNPTAITSPATATQVSASPVYDLQGRRLNHAPRHGVFIQDGRKIVR